MGYVLLRLAAPLQSWGVGSKHVWRKTADQPSKSGVVGLVAAALGRRRTDPVDDLARFGFAVRIDQPGLYERDYQTAKRRVFDPGSQRWVPSKRDKDAWVVERFYLADAIFVAGLEMPDDRVAEVEDALLHPAFPLYLGRRSCPPSQKVLLEAGEGDMVGRLREVPWQATRGQLLRSKGGDARVEVPVLLDEELSQGEAVSVETVDDVPVSFSQAARLYSARRVVRELWRVTNPHYDGPGADHDPMALLGEG